MADLTSTRVYGDLSVTGNIEVREELHADSIKGDGSGLTDLNAGNISSGTLPTARGGTGRTDGRSPRWVTGRTLTVGSTGKTVDGSANVSWTLAEIGAAPSTHSHTVTWTGGTTAGPTLSVQGGAAVAVPAASGTASGIVTTGAQTFGGNKTLSGTTTCTGNFEARGLLRARRTGGDTGNRTVHYSFIPVIGDTQTTNRTGTLTNTALTGNRTWTLPNRTGEVIVTNGTTRAAGTFYGGTTAPTSTTRLNYDGNFHATNFYGNGANLTNLNASNLASGTVPNARLPIATTEQAVAGTAGVLPDAAGVKAYVDASAWPVGSTYVQFPGQSAPSTLFGGTWSQLFNTEGVFFRTEGGNASAFGGGIQVQEIRSHGHNAVIGAAGAHSHAIATKVTNRSGNALMSNQNYHPESGHTHILNRSDTTEAVSNHTHTISVNTHGGAETRPLNRTIRVWVRTA